MRYFFHIRSEDGVICDEEGSELPDIDAARTEARLSAREFAMDDLRRGVPVAPRRIEIADDSGQVLSMLPVRDVVS